LSGIVTNHDILEWQSKKVYPDITELVYFDKKKKKKGVIW
jgi:hypothetical protein